MRVSRRSAGQKEKKEGTNMLRDRIDAYYLEKNHNCAETTLRILSDEYGLGLGEEDIKLVGAFGGGMSSGLVCGALCGAMAALGKMVIEDVAHAAPGFKELCAECTAGFREALGAVDCRELKEMYHREDGTRCLLTVQKSADYIEGFLKEHGLPPAREPGEE